MAILSPYYTTEFHGAYETADIGDLVLEEGSTLRGCRLAYTTQGELNAARDNAVLVTTWYSGTHRVMEDLYIGEGHALDPSRYFIVCVNQIGNGLSSSPHNYEGAFTMGRFPKVRIGDDVVAQERLLRETLGVEQLALVVGGSMGAQQTYEWAVRFPDKVQRAAPLAGTAKNTPHDFLFTQTLIDTLQADPAWNGGFYAASADVRDGLRRHNLLWSVMGYCPGFFKREDWRGLGFSSVEDFQIGFMDAVFNVMDPNDLLAMAWKWQRGDVSRHTGGDLAAALERVTAKTFVMPISTDMFFPPEDCADEQAMIKGSELRVIESGAGHLGLFHLEPSFTTQVDDTLRELLDTDV